MGRGSPFFRRALELLSNLSTMLEGGVFQVNFSIPILLNAAQANCRGPILRRTACS